MANPEMTTAIARPARSGGTIEVAVVIAAAMNSPCTAPMSTRATEEGGVPGAEGRQQVAPATNTAVAASSTTRRSNRVVTEGQQRAADRESERVRGDEGAGGGHARRQVGGDEIDQADDEHLGAAHDERAGEQCAEDECGS